MIKEIWIKYKKDITYIVSIVVLVFVLLCSVRSCNDYRRQTKTDESNIESLVDSIIYYKGKTDNLVAEKTILVGDKKTLELANEDLYNKLQDMRIKNAEQAVHIESLINNPQKDTLWNIDTLLIDTSDFSKAFNFDNNFRKLSGTVDYSKPNLSLNILEDKVFVDYTLAIKDNKVYVSSSNPYVEYKEISGITLPSPKPKRWNIGIQAGVGPQYGFINKSFDMGFYLGAGVSYGFGF